LEQPENTLIPGVLNNHDEDEGNDSIQLDEQQGENQKDDENESNDEQQAAEQPSNNDATSDNHAENKNNEDTQQLDKRYGARTTAYNLRPRRPRDYGHLHTTLECIMMTQHSLKKVLQLYGEDAVQAVLKELKQVHDRKVMTPKKLKSLSPSERRAALQYLMFEKRKRCGTIKGRGCADGRKQREYITKEEASSPTVAIESVMLSCCIEAQENRDVATVDIPGAFMQAEIDETVHVKLEGTMAELMVRLDPKLYRQYVQNEHGKPVLYVELNKALYGTLRAALLFWEKLSNQLQEWGFTINPYDWCVANKTVHGRQCTVLWHVDDLKISHEDPDVVTSLIGHLEQTFGQEAPLTIMRGNVHEYLGMTIDYGVPGKVKISMNDYVRNVIEEVPEDMDGVALSPAVPSSGALV
jgi:hypothetical protein